MSRKVFSPIESPHKYGERIANGTTASKVRQKLSILKQPIYDYFEGIIENMIERIKKEK